MKTQYYLAILLVLALGSEASATESNRVPEGIPPLTGKAAAGAIEGEDVKSGWTIDLTLPRDTWLAIQGALPKLNWPEPTWNEMGPGLREGTMILVGDDMPTRFRVVDMAGNETSRAQILEQLKTEQPVLVSVDGSMPDACYLRLPTPAKLLLLLGPGGGQDVADMRIPAKAANEQRDTELNDWTEAKSQKYFFNLMQKSRTFKIQTDEEASKYLQGVWRLDKRAHIGGGHYVRADRGEDVTVACTDRWLVVTALTDASARDMAVARVERIEPDEGGHLQVKTRNSVSFDRFQPLDEDHMAVLAYDYIAVVKRIACETPESQEGEEQGGEVKRQPYVDELPDEVSAMAGLWRIDPDFDRLLGTPAESNRHPNSLRLGFAVPGAPLLRKETISLVEDLFVRKMGHTIVAVGKWETATDSKVGVDRDSQCFVTTKNGATYLWFGTPDKSLFGSEVHHVRVSTRKKLLILDGNSMLPPRMRKPENVRAYFPADRNEAIDRP